MTVLAHPSTRTLLFAAALAWVATSAGAQHQHHAGMQRDGDDPHAAHRAMMEQGAGGEREQQVAGLSIPDVMVQTQDGEHHHFYRDLVAGKVVAMNFVFTTCTTICPPMGANFGRLQKELGDRLGTEVFLISVSVDPTTDTPQRLEAWGDKFGARDGWSLVTGDQQEIERLLKALQVFNADIREHSPVVLIGDDAAGRWTRAYGLAGPRELAAIVDRVVAGEDHAGHSGAPHGEHGDEHGGEHGSAHGGAHGAAAGATAQGGVQ